MSASNSVTLTGNITREPELRYTPSGAAVVKFGLAVNRYYKDRSGNTVENTDFIDVTAWRELGENVAESLKTGTRVVVTGRFQQDRWENDGGEKRSKLFVVAEEVAASLRFATVDVTKTTRSSSGSSESEGEESAEPSAEELAAATAAPAAKGKTKAAAK
jgi:single-strand DNA-binding protein